MSKMFLNKNGLETTDDGENGTECRVLFKDEASVEFTIYSSKIESTV